MYRFQIKAPTQDGEMIGIVGAIPQLGSWDVKKYLPLNTSSDRYPIWSIDIAIEPLILTNPQEHIEYKIEYKYVRITANGQVQWESDLGENRWVPIEPEHLDATTSTIIIDDGAFGYIQPFPYGYLEHPIASSPSLTSSLSGIKVLVLGSSVAMGCSAWLLKGWASKLGLEAIGCSKYP